MNHLSPPKSPIMKVHAWLSPYISWSAHMSRDILIVLWFLCHDMLATFHQSMVYVISTNPMRYAIFTLKIWDLKVSLQCYYFLIFIERPNTISYIYLYACDLSWCLTTILLKEFSRNPWKCYFIANLRNCSILHVLIDMWGSTFCEII